MRVLFKKILQFVNKSPSTVAFTLFVISFLIIVPITAGWSNVCDSIFPNSTMGLYNRNFWENVLVEAHGFLFDILIIGVVVSYLDSRRNIKEYVSRHREDIEDLAHLDTPEINMKKVGIIKRLNSINIFDIKVQNLVLAEVNSKGLIFKKSKVIGLKIPNGSIHSFTFEDSNVRSSNFSRTKITNTSFLRCDLYKTDFSGSAAAGTNFTGSILDRAKFVDANICNAIFKGSDLRGVSFTGANLRNANFIDAENLSTESLIEASCLDYIVIEKALRSKLLRLRKDVKFSDLKRDNG